MSTSQAVTLLITHFNRPASLERLLQGFKDLNVAFANTVVSDDASRPENLERLSALQKEHGFTLITTPTNRGLGNNINKGEDAVTTPYTLYVQEDFCPTPAFPQRFAHALELMDARGDIDLIRFYTHEVKYPCLRPYKYGFAEMIFKLLRPGTTKFFSYSDTPHLRRRSFFTRFGRYKEGVRAIKCEKAMVMSFLQARGKALICEEGDMFTHENCSVEPSTQDYSDFFKIKRLVPDALFDAAWTLKLTLQLLFVRYRT